MAKKLWEIEFAIIISIIETFENSYSSYKIGQEASSIENYV